MDKVTVGRRKAAVARATVKAGKGSILINGKDYKDYFPEAYLQHKVEAPLKVSELEGSLDVSINVFGGGVKGQAEAISLAIARSIIVTNEDKRPALKKEKLLRRDARVVERKKTGLRKARKREQYSKR
ncbi:MAG: 30S ribosomal protein S9 [Chitinophagales bacterium]|nr:30S ribosomal protein S9 [Chitinophagales bacterium]MCO5281734.1 30S ribosomal protein S9 [Chitinophagales bacterium]OJV31412.1 MAG: 30S ribosomal protein S9 [Bacteroidetes bacterium 37-13]HRN94962.1 30S ribosomal protein S9 [Chitinophagales bacterium]HRP38758.1 30S ribosomal protein S9 [Chitinophagales bacterium]